MKCNLNQQEENLEIGQKQIKQDSMRYILAVKESIKELTVEVVLENNLEKEILHNSKSYKILSIFQFKIVKSEYFWSYFELISI